MENLFFDDRVGQWYDAIENTSLGGMINAMNIRDILVECIYQARKLSFEDYCKWQESQGRMAPRNNPGQEALIQTMLIQLGAVHAAIETYRKHVKEKEG